MPSPFPSMDPYLESPLFWRSVHNDLIIRLKDELNAQLPPQFVAPLEERVYLSLPDGVYPDVALTYQPRPLDIEGGGRGCCCRCADRVPIFGLGN